MRWRIQGQRRPGATGAQWNFAAFLKVNWREAFPRWAAALSQRSSASWCVQQASLTGVGKSGRGAGHDRASPVRNGEIAQGGLSAPWQQRWAQTARTEIPLRHQRHLSTRLHPSSAASALPSTARRSVDVDHRGVVGMDQSCFCGAAAPPRRCVFFRGGVSSGTPASGRHQLMKGDAGGVAAAGSLPEHWPVVPVAG